MLSPRQRRRLFGSCALLVMFTGSAHGQQQARRAGYDQLIALFTEWRQFQRPKSVNDVPDYTAAAMTAQQRALPELQRRLAALDTAGWSRAQQVDWRIVRAEMNGLDFDHRVLRPWVQNPAFYVTVFTGRSDQPAREGTHAAGTLEVWRYTFPLSPRDAAEVLARLRIIPPLLQQ